MCRKAFCRHVRVVGHRQRVGHVQYIETPGRERGGDLGRTRIFERACDVSDTRQTHRSILDVILTRSLRRHPLPFKCRIVPRLPGMNAEKLEQLIAASTA